MNTLLSCDCRNYFFLIYQSPKLIPICLAALTIWSFGETILSLPAHSARGTLLILPLMTPIIIPYSPSRIASAAPAPILVESTRSYGHGSPPRCVCPGTVMRTSADLLIDLICDLIRNRRIFLCFASSFSLYFFFVSFASSFEIAPSATARMVKRLPCFGTLLDCRNNFLCHKESPGSG